MSIEKNSVWVHHASGLYCSDTPIRLLETIWIETPGWGYMLRRDLWTYADDFISRPVSSGYKDLESYGKEDLRRCPSCGLLMIGLPGALASSHIASCSDGSRSSLQIDEIMIENRRIKLHEAEVMLRLQREKGEKEEAERRERTEKLRDEVLARLVAKDRKKRLKDEAREQLIKT
jgi:hypothetical protein